MWRKSAIVLVSEFHWEKRLNRADLSCFSDTVAVGVVSLEWILLSNLDLQVQTRLHLQVLISRAGKGMLDHTTKWCFEDGLLARIESHDRLGCALSEHIPTVLAEWTVWFSVHDYLHIHRTSGFDCKCIPTPLVSVEMWFVKFQVQFFPDNFRHLHSKNRGTEFKSRYGELWYRSQLGFTQDEAYFTMTIFVCDFQVSYCRYSFDWGVREYI